ncbi:MAG TPA: 7-carboxy-7-deazaguanine synthase QueE [Dehalococcoidales bacterium]|jgi:7-carboxy-7-deazaguanine synthase
MLKVSKKADSAPEIFYSIQGEGANLGQPAVFLRLAGCNLKCAWCDTKYSWDWQHFDPRENSLEMSLDMIETEIMQYTRPYLVVTGGEPLVQQKQLIPLIKRLKKAGFYIEIETNGTLVPDAPLFALVDHWSLSPKLRSSGNPPVKRQNPAGYRMFAETRASHFKFVIQDQADFNEVLNLIEKYKLPTEKIILMPEGQTKEKLLQKSEWLVDLCKKHGYRFSPRLQTLLWGNERGK